jgi:hypothetical protein
VEAELAAWYYDEICDVSFANNRSGLKGFRGIGDAYLLQASDGSPVIQVIGRKGSRLADVKALLGTEGTAAMKGRRPDPDKWHLAALKQAYLAACVSLQQIPSTEEADAIRAALIAVRNSSNRHSVPKSQLANNFFVGRESRCPA